MERYKTSNYSVINANGDEKQGVDSDSPCLIKEDSLEGTLEAMHFINNLELPPNNFCVDLAKIGEIAHEKRLYVEGKETWRDLGLLYALMGVNAVGICLASIDVKTYNYLYLISLFPVLGSMLRKVVHHDKIYRNQRRDISSLKTRYDNELNSFFSRYL